MFSYREYNDAILTAVLIPLGANCLVQIVVYKTDKDSTIRRTFKYSLQSKSAISVQIEVVKIILNNRIVPGPLNTSYIK